MRGWGVAGGSGELIDEPQTYLGAAISANCDVEIRSSCKGESKPQVIAVAQKHCEMKTTNMLVIALDDN
jgi:hypothetical protein